MWQGPAIAGQYLRWLSAGEGAQRGQPLSGFMLLLAPPAAHQRRVDLDLHASCWPCRGRYRRRDGEMKTGGGGIRGLAALEPDGLRPLRGIVAPERPPPVSHPGCDPVIARAWQRGRPVNGSRRGYDRDVTMTAAADDTRIGIVAAACLFRSLADPTRLALIGCLAEGEQRVVDVTRRLGLAQSTVSGHLACLRDCGLVDWRPAGRQSFYFLARPELPGLLTSAEQVLAATGSKVTLCPSYGLARAR
jgi:DNA-binding transcriptional ArsR family regulator